MAVAIQHGLTIRWVRQNTDASKTAVVVEGLTSDTLQTLSSAVSDAAQWTQIFAVYVDEQGKVGPRDLPPMQGRYEILKDRLRFAPQFPAQPGMNYRVEVRTEKLATSASTKSQPVVVWFRMPAPVKAPKTVVQRVYPSANKLPENLLKFYIHFSGPMSRGRIYEHIHLLEASGKPVELPFLEIDEELWNPEMTRLTLFIDPGRIKRGVKPLEEVGPSIQAGKRYALVIDQTWRDSDGVPLKTSFRKAFEAGPPDREPPNPTSWTIKVPKENTRDPLVIRFREPMDRALAQRLIRVIDANHRKLAGQVALSDQERQWSFTPDTNWQAGPHQIVADTLLEDLAGNGLGRPFEVDVFERVEERTSQQTVALPFQVGPR